jgi:hypothetical protein
MIDGKHLLHHRNIHIRENVLRDDQHSSLGLLSLKPRGEIVLGKKWKMTNIWLVMSLMSL